jgi:glutamate-1-semialdehyde 2,1-aminomutase
VTGRDRILKFDGCYHGHSDGLLVGAGSGVATLGIPGSPGVPSAMTELTVQAPFNDLAAVASAFERWGDELACVIVEPIAGNMGCIPPVPGFLSGLRELCDEHGALLVFDEVMTGFRVAYGGAGKLYGVSPDLVCLGKVVGGGLPAAAYGGRREWMERIAPEGDVYQAGTLSGNPLAVAAGLETLRLLQEPGVYERLGATADALTQGLADIARAEGVEFCTQAIGGMIGFFFHPGPVHSYEDSKKSHDARFQKFFASMLDQGVYLAPSRFEAGFVSLAHRPRDIAATLDAARVAMKKAARVP